MKKKRIFSLIVLIIGLITSCDNESQKFKENSASFFADSNLVKYQLRTPLFHLLQPGDEIKLRNHERGISALVSANNNFKNEKVIFEPKKNYSINYNTLKNLVDNTPDGGYIYFEFGLKEKNKNGNKTEYKNQILQISILNRDSTRCDTCLKNNPDGFVKNNKTTLKEAYTALNKNGILHFDPSENFGGVIFMKDSCLSWLTKVTKNPIIIEQVSEAYKTTVLVIGEDINKNLIYGNRGGTCCANLW